MDELSKTQDLTLRPAESERMNRRKLLLALGTTTMTNVFAKSIDVAEWTEELMLSDGQMTTVWRRARAYSGGWPNSARGSDIDSELKYIPLGIHWKGDWKRRAMAFDIINGIPYLVLYISDKESCANKPKTDYSAQFLQWKNGQWSEVKQVEFPVHRVFINLSSNYWGSTVAGDYKGLIAWSRKRLPGGYNQKAPDTVKLYFERGNNYCSRFLN